MNVQKNIKENAKEAVKDAKICWGQKGWDLLGSHQQVSAVAAELLLTLESFHDDTFVEQFGKDALPGLHIIQSLINETHKAI